MKKYYFIMVSERDKRDLRCIAISFIIPLIGSLIQSFTEGLYGELNRYVIIILSLAFLFLIPILIRVYFTDWEDYIIKHLRNHKTAFNIIGVTCACFCVGYIVVYIENILS